MKNTNNFSFGITGSNGFGRISLNGSSPAYSLKTVSGSTPLTITDAVAQRAGNIIIYGNTEDTIGVGDLVSGGGTERFAISVKQNNSEYTLYTNNQLLSRKSLNLLPMSEVKSGTSQGITADIDGNTIHIYGTSTGYPTLQSIHSLNLSPGNYYLYSNISQNPYIRVRVYIGNSYTDCYANNTFTITGEETNIRLRLALFGAGITIDEYVQVAIYPAGTITDFHEPYGESIYDTAEFSPSKEKAYITRRCIVNDGVVTACAPQETDISALQNFKLIPALVKGTNTFDVSASVPASGIAITYNAYK